MSSVAAPPPFERTESAKTMHPPGAWNDGPTTDAAYDDAGDSPIAAIGNSFSGALSAAGNMAATYLPANVVSSIAAYAPGIVPQPTTDRELVKKPNLANSSSTDVHQHSLTEHPLPEPLKPTEKPPSLAKISPEELQVDKPSVVEKIGPADISTATQFASPTSISPASSESFAYSTNVGAGNPRPAGISTTAVLGHSGIMAPPSSAATNNSAPSRDTSLPFGTKSNSLGTTSGGTSISDAPGVPSSTLSMKSGIVGSGPTHDDTSKMLPPIPSPADGNGVTPRASALENDDLHYLAPAIRPHDSAREMVPTTRAANQPVNVDTGSRFAEGASPAPMMESPQSSGPPHSRTGSEPSNGSGSPRGKVTFANRIKGEAKILKGKLTKDDVKVQEGRDILSGEL